MGDYQAGLAGIKNSQRINFTSWSCDTVHHSRSYCVAFSSQSCSSEGCGCDYTCLNPNEPSGPTVRMKMLLKE